MNISGKGVEIKCRRCGKTSKAEDFALDYVYKMAVCPSCIKERKNNDFKTLKQSVKDSDAPHIEAPKPIHPPGWDAEDEYLEKLERQKQKASGQTESTPKPYQMSSVYKTQQPNSSPKPQSTSQPAQRMTQEQPRAASSSQSSKPMDMTSFGMRSASKPAEQPHAASSSQSTKPMSMADFGMRSTSKPTEQSHAAPSSQPSKPMDMTSFGMRSSGKTNDAPEQHQKGSILGDRAEKANADPDKTKYKCKKCNYEFFYNRERNMPRACPYCNTQVLTTF